MLKRKKINFEGRSMSKKKLDVCTDIEENDIKGKVNIPKLMSPANTEEKGKNTDSCENVVENSQKMKENRFKALEEQLLKYSFKQKLFYLTDVGKCAQTQCPLTDKKGCFSSPLFVEDIRNLLLRSVLGRSPFPIHWSKLTPTGENFKTVLIEIEGFCLKEVSEIHELFRDDHVYAPIVEIMSSNLHFATELSVTNFSTCFSTGAGDYSLFPVEKKSHNITEKSTQRELTKLHLLLKPIQLAMESYPLPENEFTEYSAKNYCFTKTFYKPVCADSPMFALDCEMGINVSGKQEVLWIAIVNEDLEIVYHSFVKPKEKIVDYMTEFSGVTEEMLKDVKTTLKDVQKAINNILPSDAILCGQSLNCDLHALKLIHPYVIDTSVVFNTYGIRGSKSSLKQLTLSHLKENIQMRSHNPIEDSVASMKLVLFRLKNRLNGKSETLSEQAERHGFFARLSKRSKNVCIVGNGDSFENYCRRTSDTITFVQRSSIKEIMQETLTSSILNDLTLSNVRNTTNCSIHELKSELKNIYGSFSNETLFILIMSDVHKKDKYFKYNYGIIVFKKRNF